MPEDLLPSSVDRARSRARRFWRTRVLAHRRLLVAACLGVAVAAGVRAVAPPPPATEPVLVAARDLPSGTVLTSDDLVRARWPAGSRPDGAAARWAGRTLAAPLRRGEPLTDVRLTAPSLVDGYPGLVALPVRLPDAAAVGLLRVGDEIDLVASDPEAGTAEVVASGSPVLALPLDDAGGAVAAGQPTGGRLVVLGLTPAQVRTVSAAAAREFLTPAFAR
ncbi:Flp pilus assembly protein CpaB [Nocardioides solisilvae]|uniref:Flp pilus assembly protein CpaB n=1 Tax=Nocardioides solisilvae TaxID=1542435 RepID=UPI000D742796|nr:SAF domain-containing protein [Nocardioides solisilvae]